MNTIIRALLGGFLGGTLGFLFAGWFTYHRLSAMILGCFFGSLVGYWNRDMAAELRRIWPSAWLAKLYEASTIPEFVVWFRRDVENRIKFTRGVVIVFYYLGWICFGVICLSCLERKSSLLVTCVFIGLAFQAIAVVLAPLLACFSSDDQKGSSDKIWSIRGARYERGWLRFVAFELAAHFRAQLAISLGILGVLGKCAIICFRLLVIPAVPLLVGVVVARVLLGFSARSRHLPCFFTSMVVVALSTHLFRNHMQGWELYALAALVGGASAGWAVAAQLLIEASVRIRTWACLPVSEKFSAWYEACRKQCGSACEVVEARLWPIVLPI